MVLDFFYIAFLPTFSITCRTEVKVIFFRLNRCLETSFEGYFSLFLEVIVSRLVGVPLLITINALY